MRLRKQQRMILVVVAVLLLGGATALVMAALSDSVAFFATPTDIALGKVESDKNFRIGGLVVEGSVRRAGDRRRGDLCADRSGRTRSTSASSGHPPGSVSAKDKGIVAQGKIGPNGTFIASEVLAKHDENYMPAEVAESLKQAGMWNEGEGHSEGVIPEANAEGTTE